MGKIEQQDNGVMIKARAARFIVCIGILVVVIMLAVTGCANYSLKNNITTTTVNKSGEQVIHNKQCELLISSMREVKAGDLKISKDCALKGSAESLGANDKLIDLMTTLIKKVP